MPWKTESFAVSDSDLELLPSEQDIVDYANNGWYLSRKLFTDDEVDRLAEAAERYYAGHRDRVLPSHPPKISYWTPEKGDVQRHNDYVHYESDEIAEILRKPIVAMVAARLAQVDEIRMFQSTLIYKPPRADETSNLVPWHTDRDYWASSTSEKMLTAFIPFHDCDEQMGTITMVDGSHRWLNPDASDITALHFAKRADLDQVLRRAADFNNAEIRTVPMRIPKGHMSFHHCRVYHGSGANRSTAPRRAISLHLQDGDNAYREFTLPDGSVATYNHDTLVRRTLDGRPDYADPTFCPVLWKETG